MGRPKKLSRVDELSRILALLHKYKVQKFSFEDLTIEFNSTKPEQNGTQSVKSEPLSPAIKERQPSDDEMLFYSTDHFDDLRASREENRLPDS